MAAEAAATAAGTPEGAPTTTSTPAPAPAPPSGQSGVRRGGGQFPAHGRRASDGAPGAPGAGRTRPVDRMLSLLLLAAERDARMGITVTVGGVVVTGTLVGTLAYCRALADQFASTAGGTDMDGLFADSFRDLVDDAAGAAHGDRRSPPDAQSYEQSVSFLHLADARYVGPAGLLPAGRQGMLWRCPVSDVCGWSLGDLTAR